MKSGGNREIINKIGTFTFAPVNHLEKYTNSFISIALFQLCFGSYAY